MQYVFRLSAVGAGIDALAAEQFAEPFAEARLGGTGRPGRQVIAFERCGEFWRRAEELARLGGLEAGEPGRAPAAGVTVYPTFIFGVNAFATVTLSDIEVAYLDKPEKIDPTNQLRMASFKFFNGTFIKNASFALRIESGSQFSLTNG